MKKIKVNFSTGSHSTGRGIGFYSSNLAAALKSLPNISLTDKNPDINHYPYFDLFYPTLRPDPLTLTVVTIHDLTPLMLPHFYPKGIKGRLNLHKQKQSLKLIAAVITDSQNSKQDIISKLGIPAEKIHVTPLAVDPIYAKPVSDKHLQEVKQKYSLPDQFVLYVGGVNPNKNLPRLIRATDSLKVPLVFVGSEFTKPTPVPTSFRARIGLQSTHPELKDLHFIKKAITHYPHISALGFVDNSDLAAIYRLASLYCQPSIYEGFGLPVLEAMSAGCLIVSSNSSSLPEIYPQETITFDPHSHRSLTKALKKALSLNHNEKLKLIKSGQKRAKDFSWKNTAELTAQVYSTVLNP